MVGNMDLEGCTLDMGFGVSIIIVNTVTTDKFYRDQPLDVHYISAVTYTPVEIHNRLSGVIYKLCMRKSEIERR